MPSSRFSCTGLISAIIILVCIIGIPPTVIGVGTKGAPTMTDYAIDPLLTWLADHLPDKTGDRAACTDANRATIPDGDPSAKGHPDERIPNPAVLCTNCDAFCEARPAIGWFNAHGGLVFQGPTRGTVIPKASVQYVSYTDSRIIIHTTGGELTYTGITEEFTKCVFSGIAKRL
jgi:hypothetical protein